MRRKKRGHAYSINPLEKSKKRKKKIQNRKNPYTKVKKWLKKNRIESPKINL